MLGPMDPGEAEKQNTGQQCEADHEDAVRSSGEHGNGCKKGRQKKCDPTGILPSRDSFMRFKHGSPYETAKEEKDQIV